jgi:7-cyano-7-deazaguanine synthase
MSKQLELPLGDEPLPRAVVLLSGGLDSTTALAQAIADGAKAVTCVSVQYGSKHNTREARAARDVVQYYSHSVFVDLEIVNMPSRIFQSGKSALMNEIDMPHQTYKELMEGEGPSPTVVPFRNANLISIATAIAIRDEAPYVYAGMHAEDAHNWSYPDCTPEFLGAMANAVYVGSYHAVRLVFPFIWMGKDDIVTRAMSMSVPLDLTYSCYEGHEYHCGQCPTCVERKEAFRSAGVEDPTEYEV